MLHIYVYATTSPCPIFRPPSSALPTSAAVASMPPWLLLLCQAARWNRLDQLSAVAKQGAFGANARCSGEGFIYGGTLLHEAAGAGALGVRMGGWMGGWDSRFPRDFLGISHVFPRDFP